MKKLLLLSLCLTLHVHTYCMDEGNHFPQAEAEGLAEELIEDVFDDLFAALDNHGHQHAPGNPAPHAIVGALMAFAPQAPEPQLPELAHHAPEEDAVND